MHQLMIDNTINKPTYEECYSKILTLVNNNLHRWRLKAVSHMDTQDVSQEILLHIYTKWHLYKPEFPLENWAQRVIMNKINNLLRDVYYLSERPCLSCPADEGDNLCRIYVKQCSSCPLYANWIKNKKSAHDIRLPVTIEHHTDEVQSIQNNSINFGAEMDDFILNIQKVLTANEFKIFTLFYLDNKSDGEVAELMGYKNPNVEKNIKQVKNIKNNIFKKAKDFLSYDQKD